MPALAILQSMAQKPREYALIMALGTLEEGGETIELTVMGMDQIELASSLIRPQRLPKTAVHGIGLDELPEAPLLSVAWPLLRRGLENRRFLGWNTPLTLQVLSASLGNRDAQRELGLGTVQDLRPLFRDAHAMDASDLLTPKLDELLKREGLPQQGLLFPQSGTGNSVQSLQRLLTTTGSRLLGGLRFDDASHVQYYVRQAAGFLFEKGGGALTWEDREGTLVGGGATLLELQGRLWQRALANNIFLSFARRADSPEVLRITGYPLIHGEAGLGLGGIPVGIESKFDGNRRPFLALHFASAGDPARPACADDLPHGWGSIEREPTGERLSGPWGEQDTRPSASSPHARNPQLFRALSAKAAGATSLSPELVGPRGSL